MKPENSNKGKYVGIKRLKALTQWLNPKKNNNNKKKMYLLKSPCNFFHFSLKKMFVYSLLLQKLSTYTSSFELQE